MHALLKRGQKAGVRKWSTTMPISGWGHYPAVDHEVTIEIDVDHLMYVLGNAARRNKSRMSKRVGIKVRVQEGRLHVPG